MKLPDTVLQAWTHTPQARMLSTVLPDGCRDLLLRIAPGGPPIWTMTGLDDQAYSFECQAGEIFAGFRLQPGTQVDEAALLAAVQGHDFDDPYVSTLLADCTSLEPCLADALGSLSETGTVCGSSRQLGMCERSLERLVRGGTGRSPVFWKNLARIRRAGHALSTSATLAEVAVVQGYADQAHMSRDFRRWFGVSPSQFRQDPSLRGSLLPGFGAASGKQPG